MIQKSWLSFLCALVILINSSVTYAQSNTEMLKYALECDGNDFSLCAQPLLKGEEAPFDGQLLTPELAISLSQRAMAFESQLGIELERLQNIHAIELGYHQDINELDKESSKKQIALLEKRLDEARGVAWYRTPVFVSIVSCAATILVVVGAVYLVKEID